MTSQLQHNEPLTPDGNYPAARASLFAPLSHRTFRNVWVGSLFSHTGMLIQGVGAAWAMTEMASANMVALVQTASFLPMMLFSIPSGAFADMFDRRNVQITALSLAFGAACLMMLAAYLGLLTPWPLLFFCFLIGTAMSLFGPAWQSSTGEQVPSNVLPQAITLNSAGYNVARSVGPAIGGGIVALAGVGAAFGVNALCYLPLLVILWRWKRVKEPTRLPPERISRAIVSGLRFLVYMQPARKAVIRTAISGLLGASIVAMMPLLARDVLSGDATTYGLLLGSFGIGSVIGILYLGRLRVMGSEQLLRLLAVAMAVGLVAIAFTTHLLLACLLLLVIGAAWTSMATTLNIALQTWAPRWVVGRVVATFQATMAGGIAVGSWIWGIVAEHAGPAQALWIAAILFALTPFIGMLLPIEDRDNSEDDTAGSLVDPDIKLGISGRSGPISIAIEYRIAADRARDFYNLMQEVEQIRSRNGAYGWLLSRDLSDPELWIERYWCPTWHDYLRQRNRSTAAELAIQQQAIDLHIGLEPVQVRRMLERPYGSVRWRADTPDRGSGSHVAFAAADPARD